MVSFNLAIKAVIAASIATWASALTLEQIQKNVDRVGEKRAFMRKMKAASFDHDVEIDRVEASRNMKEELIHRSKKATPALKGATPVRRLDEGDDAVDWDGRNFDLSLYSLKYHKCTSMTYFNSEEGGNKDDEDNLFVTQNLITLRLCPTEYCEADGWSGCKSDYGDYLIELNDFLEVQETYDEAVFEQYCAYCETCMYFENYFYGNRRMEDAAGDDGDDGDDGNSGHACKYYDQCVDYQDACGGDEGDDDGDDNANEMQLGYSDFRECVEVAYNPQSSGDDAAAADENAAADDGAADEGAADDAVAQQNYYRKLGGDDDGNVVYLGLYCDGDVNVGVFSDDECSVKVGDQDDVYTNTGLEISSSTDWGSFFDSECISCLESDLPYSVSQKDEEDEDNIIELCEEVYDRAAGCDKNLYEFTLTTGQKNTCEYIENVMTGKTDEYGFVEGESGYLTEYMKKVQHKAIEISPLEIAALTLGAVGCFAMSIAAVVLTKRIIQANVNLIPKKDGDDEIEKFRSID